ncbi:epoxyqueuosine reductase [Sediminispirochaeta bajacaliforniensis]|uniref:epoxyqueuosine reductase n=1 Tax=Sediminispirochaeta bajacaliforniensis TaxID=148 RepID=UPI000375C64B|nr:epoxyqueuosine reductase [Sediminispirochaeta bajacaliforniensis]
MITAETIKEQAGELGFDLCGIAPVERFSGVSQKSDPAHIMEGCRSVIVVAKKFLNSTTTIYSSIPYTIIRNQLSSFIDIKTVELSYFLESAGVRAVPTGAIEPCNYDSSLNRVVGLISLKNAAYQAGLGVIGKNTLLLTPKFGNMVWLGAVLTDASLTPDEVMTYSPCNNSCRLCIDACPANALDGGAFMDQKKCWNFAFGEPAEGGEWRIKCYTCRSVCPFSRGYQIA